MTNNVGRRKIADCAACQHSPWENASDNCCQKWNVPPLTLSKFHGIINPIGSSWCNVWPPLVEPHTHTHNTHIRGRDSISHSHTLPPSTSNLNHLQYSAADLEDGLQWDGPDSLHFLPPHWISTLSSALWTMAALPVAPLEVVTWQAWWQGCSSRISIVETRASGRVYCFVFCREGNKVDKVK